MLQVASPDSEGPISACSSLSQSIVGIRSAVVQPLCSPLSRGGVARVSNGHFSRTRARRALFQLVISLRTLEHDKDESERNYWRTPGG